jgi:hypothetical protein
VLGHSCFAGSLSALRQFVLYHALQLCHQLRVKEWGERTYTDIFLLIFEVDESKLEATYFPVLMLMSLLLTYWLSLGFTEWGETDFRFLPHNQFSIVHSSVLESFAFAFSSLEA